MRPGNELRKRKAGGRFLGALGLLLWLGCPTVLSGQDGERARSEKMESAIQDVLNRQTKAWNEGNLREFMEYYDHSEALTFSSAGETTRGWQAILARYQARYGNGQSMGDLRFHDLEIYPLAADAAYVLGRFHLTRGDAVAKGAFTLVMQEREGHWRIVHDHTSVPAQAEADRPRTTSAAREVGHD